MNGIVFQKVRFKNFLSAGNYFIEYDLDKSGATAIIGKNGSGKSMLLDALTFVLFGKSFRGCNKPLLINSINGSDSVVEIEFKAKGKQYKIIRGQKPSIFEIYENEILINQDSTSKDYQKFLESNILGMNFKTFTQIIVLGSSNYVPFMVLSAADRRQVIEDLLDIQIFSKMRIVLKDLVSENTSNLRDYTTRIDSSNEKIVMLESHIAKMEDNKTEEIEEQKREILSYVEQMKTLVEEISDIQAEISDNTSKLTEKSTIEKTINDLRSYEAKIQTKISNHTRTEDFYSDSKTCPKCNQKIDEEFAKNILDESLEEKEKLQNGMKILKENMQEATSKLEEFREIESHIRKLQAMVAERRGRFSTIESTKKKIEQKIKEKKNTNVDTSEYIQQIEDLRESISTLNTNVSMIKTYGDNLKYTEALLKDNGIKSKIIKEYLPVMNSLINKYLKALDFFVEFNLDENFKETVKSRYRDEFSYESFSEGQKFRINIAILLAWRDIAQMKNSANTNLLILDEVFDSSLDSEGVDEFMKLLQNILGDSTHAIIISHRGDSMIEKFERIYETKIEKGFTKFVKSSK